MTTKTLSRQQIRTRHNLMNATIQLILTNGYDKLTVTGIVHEADYTRHAFYLHFKNKEHIVQRILVEWYQSYQEDIMDHIQGLESPMREYTLWNKTLSVIVKNLPFFKQLPDLYRHEIGAPVRETIRQAILKNITDQDIQLRQGVTPELLIHMELNLFALIIDRLKKTGDVSHAKSLIDDHFRLIFNHEPPDIEI